MHASWLWAWANQIFPVAARTASARIQVLRGVTGFEVFVQPGSPERHRRERSLAALAVHGLGAIGLFRFPNPDGPELFPAVHDAPPDATIEEPMRGLSQNVTFAAELPDGAGTSTREVLLWPDDSRDLALHQQGITVSEPENWRDSGWSLAADLANVEEEIVVAYMPDRQWFVQISPRRVPGLIGRLWVRTYIRLPWRRCSSRERLHQYWSHPTDLRFPQLSPLAVDAGHREAMIPVTRNPPAAS